MSLLMKALEKAAKDRGEVRAERAPATAAAAPARSELSLEPIAAGAPVAARVEATAPHAAAAPRPTMPSAMPATAPAHEPASRQQAQAQAATVMQAGTSGSTGGSSGIGTYVREHPVMALGSLAGLFAACFGIYVYVQIFHPGLLVARPAVAPKGPPPVAQVPAAPAAPLPSAPLLKEAADETPTAQQAKPQPAPPVPVAAPEEPARGSNIKVSPGSAEPALNPLLVEAYAAFQSNQLESARDLYQRILSTEPRSIDALLGLAAIAARQGNTDSAARYYLRILELDPRHALAQSGLIALLGRADPLAAESRLRQLIAREPSGYLYFTLGNLYADQSQWAAAQQAYFQAHHLEPANPDYAYNLAVGLEHVSQPKLALDFYRRALQLAAAKGRANFNSAQAQERIGKLALQVE